MEETVPAQTKEIHLPASGDSQRATFYFTAPPLLANLRARVIVLHQNRVLETWLLRAGNGVAEAEPVLGIENVVAQDFGADTVAPAFDAALLVNDNPQGVIGITAISEGGATFFEPEGIKILIKDIRNDLSALNAPEEETEEVIKGLDDERVHKLLYALAMRGAGLAKALKAVPQLGPLMSPANRLQVVDAVSGAYFPVEFVYDDLPHIGDRVRTSANLVTFPSCADLEQRLKGNLSEEMRAYLLSLTDGVFYYLPPEEATDMPGSFDSGGRQEGVDYSGTNNQETGADEADLLKT